MKLIYRGKFNGDPETLPARPHKPGAERFREAEDPKKLSLIANGIGVGLMVALLALYLFRAGVWAVVSAPIPLAAGLILPFLTLFPHEFLHAACFREEVYLYTNWDQGMLFVVGPEDMSRSRFIFMSLLPNLLFGFLPYVLGMLFPGWSVLGIWGAMSIGMGAGDYYNVFNALTQMPKGARTYLHRFHSYWYIP